MNIRDSVCQALTHAGGLSVLRDSQCFFSMVLDLCEASAPGEEAQRSLFIHNCDERLLAPLVEAEAKFSQDPSAFQVAAQRIARLLIDERCINETAAQKLAEALASGCVDYLAAQGNGDSGSVPLWPGPTPERPSDEPDTLPRTARVPGLCGMSLPQAKRAIDQYHPFVLGTVSYEASSLVPKDHVIAQHPQPSTMAPQGSAIDLVVSAGAPLQPPQRPWPLAVAAIAFILASALFALHPWHHEDSQEPTSTTPVEQPFTVPELTGLTVDEARELVAADGTFTIGNVKRRRSSSVEKGIIISQNPEANSTTTETTIDLVVSKGPKTKPVDEPEEQPEDGSEEEVAGGDSVTPVSADTTAENAATANALQQGHAALMDGTLYYRLFENNYSQSIVSRDSSGSASQHVLPVGSQTDGSYNLIAVGGRIYYGVGYDSNGDQKYDGGTIYSNNPSFTDERLLANQSALAETSFMRFFVMGDRVYYNDRASVRSVRTDGSDDRVEASLESGTQYFCWNGQLYLVKGGSFSCVDTDGGSGYRFTVDLPAFRDFTLSDDHAITIASGGSGMSLSWYDLADGSGSTRGSATIPESYESYKGASAYGDDAIVITQESDGGTARVYRAQPDGTVTELWERSGLQLVRRPNVLGDRVYFWVVASADSTSAPCSISVYGGNFAVEDQLMSHPGL